MRVLSVLFLFVLFCVGTYLFLFHTNDQFINNEDVKIVLFNSEDDPLVVSFQRRLKDGRLTSRLCEIEVSSYSKAEVLVSSGIYSVSISSVNGKLIEKLKDYSFVDHFGGEQDPPYVIDVCGKINFAVADLDFLYFDKQNSYKDIKVLRVYKGSKPFQLGRTYSMNKLFYGMQDLPHEKPNSSHVFGLYAIPQLLKNNKIEPYVAAQVKAHFEY